MAGLNNKRINELFLLYKNELEKIDFVPGKSYYGKFIELMKKEMDGI
jgi:hypothetical protein